MGQSQMKMWNVKKYGDTGVAKTQHTPSPAESPNRKGLRLNLQLSL